MSKVRTVAYWSTLIVSNVVVDACISVAWKSLEGVNDEYIEKCDDLNDKQKKILKVCNNVGAYCIALSAAATCGVMTGTLLSKTILKA